MRLQSAAFINSKTDLHCRIQLRGQIKKLYPLYKSTTELFSSLRNNTQLSFGWFSAFFALFIQKVQQFTVRIEFCLSSLIKKPFEFFWFTQTTFFVHQKNSKGFFIRDDKQSLLRNETQFSQCTAKPSRFTVQNNRKPAKTCCVFFLRELNSSVVLF